MQSRFGFAVYIDALGTSEGQKGYERRFAKFRKAIVTTFPSPNWEYRGLAIRGLSDSVFFILQVADKLPPNPRARNVFKFQDVEDFFENLKNLQNKCLEIGMPLRGGVSMGMTKVNPFKTPVIDFIGGRAIVDAVKIEESLKMCGIVFAPKYMLDKKLHKVYDRYLRKLMKKKLIASFDVPTSFGLVESFCVRWPDEPIPDKICKRFTEFYPAHREEWKDKDAKKDVTKAAKYFAAARFAGIRCKDENGGG